MQNYLTPEHLKSLRLDLSDLVCLKTDNFNEKALLETLKDKDINLLAKTAVQLSVCGYGNQVYGNFSTKDGIQNVQTVFDQQQVKYSNPKNTFIAETDFTPRRLIRFFRYQIEEYIITTKCVSYLATKYCPTDQFEEYKYKIFPGCEHIVDITNKKMVKVIINTYKNLSQKQNIDVDERVTRILIARGYVE